MTEQTFILDSEHGTIQGTWRPGESPRGIVVLCTEPSLASGEQVRTLADSITDDLQGVSILTYRLAASAARDTDLTAQGYVAAGDETLRWILASEFADATAPPTLIIGIGAACIAAAGLSSVVDSLAGVLLISPPSTTAIARMVDPEHESWPASLTASFASFDAAKALADSQRPVLILHGAADEIVPYESSREYAPDDATAAGQIRRLVIAGATHSLGPDSLRPWLIQTIAYFVDELLP